MAPRSRRRETVDGVWVEANIKFAELALDSGRNSASSGAVNSGTIWRNGHGVFTFGAQWWVDGAFRSVGTSHYLEVSVMGSVQDLFSVFTGTLQGFIDAALGGVNGSLDIVSGSLSGGE